MTFHVFAPSRIESTKCAYCQHVESQHKCDVCDTDKPVSLKYGNMLFCNECWTKEETQSKENMKPENVQKRLDDLSQSNTVKSASLEASRAIDSSIQVRTDLFNAATNSIVELKSTIDGDESIENKPYALAEELVKRFQHFKQVVFNLNEQLIEANNQQKAIQVYLNQLANQLRAEEREKLRIQDINYKPTPPRKTDTVKTVKTTKSRIDPVELRNGAAELGISEFTLQMLVVSKGVTVGMAVRILKEQMNKLENKS